MTDRFAPPPAPSSDIDPNEQTWKPKDGPDQIEGKVVERKRVVTRAGNEVDLVQVLDPAGTIWNVWCSNFMLERCLAYYDWQVGDEIGIRYLGEKPSAKNPAHRFLDFDGYNATRPPVAPVTSASVAASIVLGQLGGTPVASAPDMTSGPKDANPVVDDDLPF